eukprot:scaffold128023_cov69-Phaeocystis_antarctica.AAC.1
MVRPCRQPRALLGVRGRALRLEPGAPRRDDARFSEQAAAVGSERRRVRQGRQQRARALPQRGGP